MEYFTTKIIDLFPYEIPFNVREIASWDHSSTVEGTEGVYTVYF